MKKVVVLGANGMLGHMVSMVLEDDSELDVINTKRAPLTAKEKKENWVQLNVEQVNSPVKSLVKDIDYVVNCIGVIKPRISEHEPESVSSAIVVNSYFPYRLEKLALDNDIRVIQIATDCVFSGAKGNYTETSQHDATDVYGKTKSLGEVNSPNFIHLRCSIIGPEIDRHLSLFEWVLSQEYGATITGFKNHKWNGITTLAFADICRGIIKSDIDGAFTQHIVPATTVNKYELLSMIATANEHQDITIRKGKSPISVDRTLRTDNLGRNNEMWSVAGYIEPPSIQSMIDEMADVYNPNTHRAYPPYERVYSS